MSSTAREGDQPNNNEMTTLIDKNDEVAYLNAFYDIIQNDSAENKG